MSIEVRNLNFQYNPKTIVLKNINLKIETGEVIALMGASGSGKSTLVKILSSFIQPTSGEVLINGNQVKFNQPYKSIAYVSQAASQTLFPWLSVRQNVYYPNKLRNLLNQEAKQYCDELLKIVGIDHRSDSFPLKLSGGEQKRLSLAVALSYKPEIVLLDEPFSGIDFKLSEELWEVLYSDFQKRKPTVLFVTHSLDEAIILSDKVVFLNSTKNLSDSISPSAKSATTPRYKVMTEQPMMDYKTTLLEKFNTAMNE